MAGLKSEGLDENMGFCAILTLVALSHQHLQVHASFDMQLHLYKPASGKVLQQTTKQMFDVMTHAISPPRQIRLSKITRARTNTNGYITLESCPYCIIKWWKIAVPMKKINGKTRV